MDDYMLRGQDEDISGIVGNDRGGQATAIDFLREHEDSLALRAVQKVAVAANRSRHDHGNRQIVSNPGPPPALKGKQIFGQVFKLSGWGYSLNERYLKLNKKGLGYFSKAPLTTMGAMNLDSPEAIELLKEEYVPKEVIPLDAIVEVATLDDQDRSKNKKFFKNPQKQGFKIIYQSGKTSKRKDLLQEPDQQSMANLNIQDLDEEKKGEVAEGAESARSSTKNLKTWLFALPDDEDTAAVAGGSSQK